jgi:hypothetical protein
MSLRVWTRSLSLALLAGVSATAQLRLYAVDSNGTEREATGLYELPSVGPEDLAQARFRARNTGTTVITLQTLSVAGQGFTVTGPSPGSVIAAGNAAEIVVRFTAGGAGSYSANLNVNALSLLMRITVVPAPVLTSEGVEVPAGTAIYLGSVLRGQTASKLFALENRGREPVTVSSLRISGSGAIVYRGPATPLTLAAGGSQAIRIEFTPPENGPYSATLSIDGRTFPLTGAGFDPPLPKPSILIEGTARSGQQPKLIVELAAVAESEAFGTLRMNFRPANDLPDDPGIRFMAAGGRSLRVQVKPGDRRVQFDGQQLREAVFQTGTTAGTLSWTLELGTHVESHSIQLQPIPPVLDNPTALRKTQDLEIAIDGFDNTRSVSQALFTFFDVSGRVISPGTIRSDVRREFDDLFRASGLATGGTFSMRATFPVQGGAAAQVSTVEVELVNSAGTGKTQRLTLQ